MSSEPAQTTGTTETTAALGELARALRRVAEGSSLDDALRSIADATLVAAAADVVVVRVLDDEGALLEARAVSASSTSVAAELQGSRTAPGAGPDALRSAGQRLGFGAALELPIGIGERELGRLELFRRARSFTAADEAIGRLAAEHAAVALAGTGGNGAAAHQPPARDLLRPRGDALARAVDEERTTEGSARLAGSGEGARGAAV